MNLLRTTTFQLTLLFAGMLIGSTALVAVLLYWATIGYVQRQTDATIEVEIAGLRDQYRARGLNGLAQVIGERLKRGDDTGAIYLFADQRLRPLAGNLSHWPDLVSRANGWYSFTSERHDADLPARARVLVLPEGLLLLVGREVSDLEELLERGLTALGWSMGLVVILALAGGALLSRRVRLRVDAINAVMLSFSAGRFDARVQLRGTDDEFDQLAENLNAMLTRTTQLMDDVRHVGDSIAHELRTPLTRLRHTIDELTKAGTVESMRALAVQATDDVDRLLTIFSALLRIARIESGTYAGRFETVHLDHLIDDALEMYDVMADERRIAMVREVISTPPISGDRDLIFQAIANLLDNALKYTQAGGTIQLSVAPHAATAVLSVTDTGGGICPDEIDLVTRRFYRGEHGGKLAGSGLGLSFVNAVAQLHGARLTLDNTASGLRVSLAFPVQDVSHPMDGRTEPRTPHSDRSARST